MMRRLWLALALLAPLAMPAKATDVKISTLPAITSFAGTEYLPLIMGDGVTMKRATFTVLKGQMAWNQWKGAWSSATAYVINDAVSYNGSSYIAIAASTNVVPTTTSTWSVIAGKGADGAGTGTVTSVTCGAGLSGGTFTTTGTCAISAPVSVANGGTGATTAGGASVDNISSFATLTPNTGFLKRTGTGVYAFIADPLPVANGGLGVASGTSGGVPCFTATTTIASSAALTANAIAIGGGAGACPSSLGSLGTTTTVLHGNAAGAPSFTGVFYADFDSSALATGANVQANTASKVATPAALWGAGAVTALTDAATIAVDLSTGINFSVTLGGNRALGNQTNEKVGQSGVIRVAQDATGSRTLSYGVNYKWASGTACVLSTAASKVDYIFYFVYSSTEILLSCVLDVR